MLGRQNFRDARILMILILGVLAVPIGFVYWLASVPPTEDIADRLGACGLGGAALAFRALFIALPFVVLLVAVLGVRATTPSRPRRLMILAALPLGIGAIQLGSIFLTV
jgi:hypothetical protein